MSNIKFTDTLECTASHGRLAVAAQIYDEQQKKTQAAINVEALKPSGTDFTNVWDENCPGDEYVVADLIESGIKKGQLITNANSGLSAATGADFPIGSVFLVIKDPVKGDNVEDVIKPIIVSPVEVAKLIKRVEDLEKRLKV